MRLNRVLLLAATINILIFALVFTISCSNGDDGPRGKEGSHCTVDEDWNIVCDGDVVGALEGGNGPQGPKGAAGKAGDGCKLGDKVGSGYQIICGAAGSEEVKGTLEGCSVSFAGDFEVDITCGSNTVGICQGKTFDPETHYCYQVASSGSVEELGEDSFGICNGVRYNNKKQYCGFAEKDAEASTIYNLCRGANTTTDIEPNKDQWNKEYCKFIQRVAAEMVMVQTAC